MGGGKSKIRLGLTFFFFHKTALGISLTRIIQSSRKVSLPTVSSRAATSETTIYCEFLESDDIYEQIVRFSFSLAKFSIFFNLQIPFIFRFWNFQVFWNSRLALKPKIFLTLFDCGFSQNIALVSAPWKCFLI